MADKHISVTHIAGSVTKGNGAKHAIATAATALCLRHDIAPRQLHEARFEKIRQAINDLINHQ